MVGRTFQITGIKTLVLRNPRLLNKTDLSERLSWAKGRKTTVEEDLIYCLMGILDITIEPNYGEGKMSAFNRMLREFIRRHPAQNRGTSGMAISAFYSVLDG